MSELTLPTQPAFILAIPVRNEVAVVAESLRRAHAACSQVAPQPWRIVLVDNGSTDGTAESAQAVADELSNITLFRSPIPGKGGAIRLAWQSFTAKHYAFSDVDLSVDLADAIPKAVAALEAGADIVAGSRALPTSTIDRPLLRRLVSKAYRVTARLIIRTKLTDLACGFKVITQDVKNRLVPLVQDQTWFFDSELLLRAARLEYRIIEISVHFNERAFINRKPSVPLLHTAGKYLLALWRMRTSAHLAISQKLP